MPLNDIQPDYIRNDLVDILKQTEQLQEVPLFATLTLAQLKLMAFTSEVFEYEAGEYLYHQGDESDAIHVILQGEAEIIGSTENGPLIFGIKTNGDLFGEMAILTGERRSAGVRVTRNSEVLKLPNDRFLELIMSNKDFALFVLKDLATKLANTTRQLTEHQSAHPAKRD